MDKGKDQIPKKYLLGIAWNIQHMKASMEPTPLSGVGSNSKNVFC